MKETHIFRPSSAAVITSGKLPHVIQKLGLIPGQHAEHLTTESRFWAETNPNYCLTFSKKEIKPFRSNRDLPTQTKSLQQINSHLFITEYLPPCSNVKSWNIFHLGKLPGAVLPRKADTHIPVSLMPRGIQSVPFSTKPKPSNSVFCLQLPVARCPRPTRVCGFLRHRWIFKAILWAGTERSYRSVFSPVTRYETRYISLDFNWLCLTLLLPASQRQVCKLSLPTPKDKGFLKAWCWASFRWHRGTVSLWDGERVRALCDCQGIANPWYFSFCLGRRWAFV